MAETQVAITVNGQRHERQVDGRMLLSDFIRQEVGLTGTHVGCENGGCGACAVLINGKTGLSCLAFAVQCDGDEVQTIESLGTPANLHPIQQAFWEKHGLQCGFCTPGMVMTAYELLNKNANPDRAEIAEAIGGNLCRCTGYQTILDAVEHAAEIMRAQQEATP